MTLLGDPTFYIAGTVAGLLALAVLKRWTARRSLPLPPGPKPRPIIGNLLDMPREKEWLTYRTWNDQYGDVVCVNVLGQKIVILGSATAVNDLMEQRGTVYSSRPSTAMIELNVHWQFTLLPYGDLWRRKRKLMHSHFQQGVADRYHSIQVTSARRFAQDILTAKPGKEALPRAVRLNIGQTILKIVYGIHVDNHDSEYISLPEKVLEDTAATLAPGRFLVDTIPILRYVPAWLPGAGFQRVVEDCQRMQRRMRDVTINVVRAQMAEGTAPPSVAQTMLEEDAALPAQLSQLEMIQDVTGVAYLGGSDTMVAAIMSFFLAMLVYPEVQTKAQAEVDRVVGQDRLPVPEDRKELLYVEGVVSECLRWLPVAPMGVPHKTTADDEYKGHFIPKDTIVLGSAWSILHNAEDYPEPERFNPGRYLTTDGQLDPSVRDPRTACFGFGRRICPGRFVAEGSMFMIIATLLSTVDVVRAKDAQGNEIVPDVDVTSGLLSHPKPFPWAVRARSQCAVDVLDACSTS